MAYFHRIGRTARAGAKGRAITFVSYSSVGDWNLSQTSNQSSNYRFKQRDGNSNLNSRSTKKTSCHQEGYGGQSRSNYSREVDVLADMVVLEEEEIQETIEVVEEGVVIEMETKNSYGGRSRW